MAEVKERLSHDFFVVGDDVVIMWTTPMGVDRLIILPKGMIRTVYLSGRVHEADLENPLLGHEARGEPFDYEHPSE